MAREIAAVTKLRLLKWEQILNYHPGKTNIIKRFLIREIQENQSQRRCDHGNMS